METDPEQHRDWRKNTTEPRKVPQRRGVGKGQACQSSREGGKFSSTEPDIGDLTGIYRELTN